MNSSVRNNIVDGPIGELPSKEERADKYAKWDAQGNLTYDDPVTGILNDYMRKDANLSDLNNVSTARTNLGLGDAAVCNIGTTPGTVCAGDDGRFLTQAQKNALTGGMAVNADGYHTHNNLVNQNKLGVANGIAILDNSGKVPAAQISSEFVVSTSNNSQNDEIVVFNGGDGHGIKRSNKLIPNGDLVGSDDAQVLTNKTLDGDNNTISNIDTTNLRAGVLNVDLTGVTSDTKVPSSKATKDYADTKAGILSNLGGGREIGHDLTGGRLSLRTLTAGPNITLTQNENDIKIEASLDVPVAPIVNNVGTGEGNVFKNRTATTVNLKTLKQGGSLTITDNVDDITLSVPAELTDGSDVNGLHNHDSVYLQKAQNLADVADVAVSRTNLGLGSIAIQDADAVAITGGNISGLTNPLPIASGGTGLNALGTANYSLTTNGNADALMWMLNDRLDNKHFAISANTDLNTLITPGVYCCESGNTTATLTNKPAAMSNSSFLMIVRYITSNYWEQEIKDNENRCWVRKYRISDGTWSDWIGEGTVAHYLMASSSQTTLSTNGYNNIIYDTIIKASNSADLNTTTGVYTIPVTGWWYFEFKVYIQSAANYTSVFEIYPNLPTDSYWRGVLNASYFNLTHTQVQYAKKGFAVACRYYVGAAPYNLLPGHNRLTCVFLGN